MCPALISQLEHCEALMKSADHGPYQESAYEMLPRERVFLIPGSKPVFINFSARLLRNA